MDKIGEEFELKIQKMFEKWILSGCSQNALDFAKDPCNNWIPETKPISFYDGCITGHKFRDEEINELVKQKAIMRNIITVKDKKINKLNEIISTQEIYINNTLRSDSDKVESKIKRLRDALELAINSMFLSVEARNDIRNDLIIALKESE